MLKRYQVLIPEWMADYVREVSKTFGINFSEAVRAELCIAVVLSTQGLFPEFEMDSSFAKIFDVRSDSKRGKMDKEVMKKNLSKLCFEARKAVEFRAEMMKKETES